MKQNIHPEYGNVTYQCVCGNTIETRSTVQGVIPVEICSSCHPFFTGKQKLMDTAGRIDRFKKKFGEKMVLGSQKKQKKPAPPVREAAEMAADLTPSVDAAKKSKGSKDKPKEK